MVIVSQLNKVYILTDDGPQEYVRVSESPDETKYVNRTTFDSNTISSDLLYFRKSERGPANQPNAQRRTYNVKRDRTIIGGDGKPYPFGVSLTITMPGGAVVDSGQVSSAIQEIVTLVTNLQGVNVSGGATILDTVSTNFVDSVRMLEI
jgi:hypothetical protein